MTETWRTHPKLLGKFHPDHAEMLNFAQEHRITPMVELMPMSQANQALRKVKENRARYRIVLVNGTAIASA